MCVIMLNMKTASIRQMQHDLNEVLSWVEQGEEVIIQRRRKTVARLLPPEPQYVETPDFLARAQRVWGKKPRGKKLSAIASEARGAR